MMMWTMRMVVRRVAILLMVLLMVYVLNFLFSVPVSRFLFVGFLCALSCTYERFYNPDSWWPGIGMDIQQNIWMDMFLLASWTRTKNSRSRFEPSSDGGGFVQSALLIR